MIKNKIPKMETLFEDTQKRNFIQTFRIGILGNVSFKPFNWWESSDLVSLLPFYSRQCKSNNIS